MSHVTNIVLHYGSQDKDKLELVNKFFKEEDELGLVSCLDNKLPYRWYGGSKPMSTSFAMGAFVDFNLFDFLAHLKTIAWDCPESVQVFARGEYDVKCRSFDLFGVDKNVGDKIEARLNEIFHDLLENQKELDADAKKVLYSNLWDLYL